MRALQGFFHGATLAAGRETPTETVQSIVAQFVGDRDDFLAGRFRDDDLVALSSALGLTLTHVRSRLDEAVALAQHARPVLLTVRHPDTAGQELWLVQYEEGSWVRLLVLAGSQFRSERLTVNDLAKRIAGDNLELVSAWRVMAMGSRVSARAAAGSEAGAHAHGDVTPLGRLWQLIKPDRRELWIVVGFAVAVGILALATPVAVQALVNFVAFGGLVQPLIVLGTVMLVFLAFAGTIQAFKTYAVEIIQRRVFVRVVSDMSTRLPRVRLDALDGRSGPELVNRYFDVMTVQKAGSSLLLDGLDVVLQAAVGLAVLGFYHPFLFVFDLILIAAIWVILQVVGRGAIATAKKESSAKYAVADALEELMRTPITYKLAGAPEFARTRLAALASDYIDKRRRHFTIVFRQVIGTVVLYAVSSTVLLTLGGWLVIQGELSLGQLIAAELIVSIALASFVKFGSKLQSYYDMLAGAEKLGYLYDLPIEDDRGESYGMETDGAAFVLRDCGYAFGGGNSLRFDLQAKPGERVLVRGGRGSGKTVLCDLLCGLRDPTRGVVLFDGIDLRDIANDSVRLQVELVRGVEIVRGSILENMRLGRSSVAIDRVNRILGRLGILDEVLALPNGLHTELSDVGAPLSRSTAQLLMIGRAVVDRPRAIIVDSVLDELDAEARRAALDVLTGDGATWTLVVTTRHRGPDDGFDRVVDLRGPAAAVGGDPVADVSVEELSAVEAGRRF
jgi:putative ABC transport system ATP-binding protein